MMLMMAMAMIMVDVMVRMTSRLVAAAQLLSRRRRSLLGQSANDSYTSLLLLIHHVVLHLLMLNAEMRWRMLAQLLVVRLHRDVKRSCAGDNVREFWRRRSN